MFSITAWQHRQYRTKTNAENLQKEETMKNRR